MVEIDEASQSEDEAAAAEDARVAAAYDMTPAEVARADQRHETAAFVSSALGFLFGFLAAASLAWGTRPDLALNLFLVAMGLLVASLVALLSGPSVRFYFREPNVEQEEARAAKEAEREQREKEEQELERLGANVRESPEIAGQLLDARAAAAAVQVIERDRARDLAGVIAGSAAAATINAVYDGKLSVLTRRIELEDLDHRTTVLTKEQQHTAIEMQMDKFKPRAPFDPAADEREKKLAKATETVTRLREVDKWEAEQGAGKDPNSDEVKRIRRLAAQRRMEILER